MKHYLSANASSEIPTSLLFVDTEAFRMDEDKDSFVLKLRLWSSCYCRLEKGTIRNSVWNSGETADEFWKYVDTLTLKKKPLWIFAHNAKYDMKQLSVYDQFTNGRLEYVKRKPKAKPNTQRGASIIAIDGRPWFMKVRHSDGSTVWLVDTMNYFNCSLEELGRSIGHTKMDIDFDKCTHLELMSYCWRDVEIIQRAMTKLILEWQANDSGNWRTSAAGLSMQNFRHLVMDHRVKEVNGIKRYSILCDGDKEAEKFERESYLGGRIEAFFIGTKKERVFHLDVKSMYPSVMRAGFYPVERLDTLQNATPTEISRLVPARGVIASCLVDMASDTLPLRLAGRQIHASGRFWCVLCGPELQRALAIGAVLAVEKAIYYRTAPIFQQWIDTWLYKRQQAEKQSDTTMAALCKLIANSLHGKFAQRGVKWHDSQLLPPMREGKPLFDWGTWIHADNDTHTLTNCRLFDGCVQQEGEGKPPEHVFPAISAYISSNARERMRELINICPERTVLYTAVDSLIVLEDGLDALLAAGEVCQGQVGKLQIKGKHDDVEIVSQGCYRLDQEWVACGLWGNAEIDNAGIWRALQFDTEPLSQDYAKAEVIVHKAIVQAPKSRPKGQMLIDGWINPYVLNTKKQEASMSPEEIRKWLSCLESVNV